MCKQNTLLLEWGGEEKLKQFLLDGQYSQFLLEGVVKEILSWLSPCTVKGWRKGTGEGRDTGEAEVEVSECEWEW